MMKQDPFHNIAKTSFICSYRKINTAHLILLVTIQQLRERPRETTTTTTTTKTTTTMRMEFFTFVFLLSLAACRVATLNPNDTDVLTHSQPTAQRPSRSETSGPNYTQWTTIHQNLAQSSPPPSLQTTPIAPQKTPPPHVPTTATTSQTSPQSGFGLDQGTSTPATTVLTSRAYNRTLTSARSPSLSSSTKHQDSAQTSTPQMTSDKTLPPSTHRTQTTDLISTSATESESPSPAPDGRATESTSFSRSLRATTKAPLIHNTKANKEQDLPTKRSGEGKAVAGIIGGALALMMLGFLVIYLQKRKLKKQQVTTRDWAGPSPFLDGGADSGQVELRSNNRISLSGFLPQRLSKRLSLLQETEEEMEDLTPGSTFGDKTTGGSFGREVAVNSMAKSNGTAGVISEMKRIKDSTEAERTQNREPLTTNNNLEDVKLGPDLSEGPAPPVAVAEKPPEP